MVEELFCRFEGIRKSDLQALRCLERATEISLRARTEANWRRRRLASIRPPTSAADCRRRPEPCKGWPSATAAGGFGLDKALAVAISKGRSGPVADPLQIARRRFARAAFEQSKCCPNERRVFSANATNSTNQQYKQPDLDATASGASATASGLQSTATRQLATASATGATASGASAPTRVRNPG